MTNVWLVAGPPIGEGRVPSRHGKSPRSVVGKQVSLELGTKPSFPTTIHYIPNSVHQVVHWIPAIKSISSLESLESISFMVFFSDLCLMFEEFLKMSPEVRSLWTAEVLLLEIFHLTLKQFGWMLPWVIRQKTIQNHGFPMISPRKSPAALQHAHARHGKIG